MSFKIFTLKTFDKQIKQLAKKYKTIKNDYAALLNELAVNPFVGADLGGGVRKIRMAISDKGKGKSGGARIITYTVKVSDTDGTVTLLTIYDKNEQENISKKDIEELLKEL